MLLRFDTDVTQIIICVKPVAYLNRFSHERYADTYFSMVIYS